MKYLLSFLVFLTAAFPVFATEQSGLFTWTFDLSSHQPGQEANLWIPYPVSDTNQLIS